LPGLSVGLSACVQWNLFDLDEGGGIFEIGVQPVATTSMSIFRRRLPGFMTTSATGTCPKLRLG